MKTNFIIGLLVVLSVLVGLYIYSLDWKEQEVIVGFNSEAQKDPMLAARLFLESKGKSLTKLDAKDKFIDDRGIMLVPDSTLIINENSILEYPSVDKYLLVWVREGGHLVYEVSPSRDSEQLQYNALLWEPEVGISHSEDPDFTNRLNIYNEPEANMTMSLENYPMSLALYSSFEITDCGGDAFSRDEKEGVVLCDLPWGDGYITYVTNLDMIKNHGLLHLDHGLFLDWLTASNERIFYLPSLYSPGWFERLWKLSWLTVIVMLLTLIFIVWRGLVRFGSIEISGKGQDSLFNKHLQAMSRFLIKHQQAEILHQALVADIDSIMEPRMPGFSQLEITEKTRILQEITGINAEQIEQLITQTVPEDDISRLRYTQEFKALKEKL
ncbi:DUF4350 domain-containing protein [Thalassotalea sp. PS06]|uniref:DUF4350 domain-containing protein n=1 Tax=Thalassotalea sp. PS06 TaxID=2594005 RepID=UPI001164EF0D|nr:DUF4350 domain-containing protein [Thalassotalea sp. PS06]QDP02318.1 hypothetical protein FNC98_13770 [Thalassotalea sp. PS06]